jgi:hypothetical protein
MDILIEPSLLLFLMDHGFTEKFVDCKKGLSSVSLPPVSRVSDSLAEEPCRLAISFMQVRLIGLTLSHES